MPHASSRSLISPGSLAIRSLLLAAIASLAFLSGAPRPVCLTSLEALQPLTNMPPPDMMAPPYMPS